MAGSRNLARKHSVNSSEAARIHSLRSPEIEATLAELRARYGKYATPDAELRSLVDKAMQDSTLTEELNAMREGR